MKTLKSFPKPAVVSHGAIGQRGFKEDGYKHPWSKWCDGKIHEITYAVDYETNETNMAAALRQHAKKFGATVRIQAYHHEGRIVFQFGEPA